MHIEPRLLVFTKGVRARIAGAVAIGLLAIGLGIARLALLGWLIGQVFAGRPLSEVLWSAAAIAAEFLDSIQGLATLKAFGQGKVRADRLEVEARDLFRRTMWVLGTNSLARGITDTSIACGAAAALIYGATRVEAGAMSLAALLIILLLGIEI